MNHFDEEAIKNYANFLDGLTANEFMLLSAAAGILLSQGLTANQANSIGNFLEAVGQLMLTYGAQKQYQDSKRR